MLLDNVAAIKVEPRSGFIYLKLGGKNAAIIFDDADLEKCVATTIRFVCLLLIVLNLPKCTWLVQVNIYVNACSSASGISLVCPMFVSAGFQQKSY